MKLFMIGICKMDEDTKTWMYDFLMPHIGHKIVCVPYGNPENPDDICIECETCNQVLFSAETEI